MAQSIDPDRLPEPTARLEEDRAPLEQRRPAREKQRGPVTLRRDVVYRFRDQGFGEIRRPVRAVPGLEVGLDPDRIVWPIAQKGERRIEVTVTSNSPKPVAGKV